MQYHHYIARTKSTLSGGQVFANELLSQKLFEFKLNNMLAK